MEGKKKKQNSLVRLMEYAGGHKKLTILGCALSGVSAVLAMAPYICIWFVARGVFASLADFPERGGLSGTAGLHFSWQLPVCSCISAR